MLIDMTWNTLRKQCVNKPDLGYIASDIDTAQKRLEFLTHVYGIYVYQLYMMVLGGTITFESLDLR